MRTWFYFARSIGAAALLSACGGSQPPIGAPDSMPQAREMTTHPDRGGSWMLPEAKSEDLLYVSEIVGTSSPVLVFSLKSHAQVGELTGFAQPYGQCVDAAGDVWITDPSAGSISKYAHGGTRPIKVLNATEDGRPVGCAVSANGGLAVSVDQSLGAPIRFWPSGSAQGALLVFQNASGQPTSYTNSDCNNPKSPGYDDRGNLYVEGEESVFYHYTYYTTGNVCELASGSSSLRVVSFTQKGGKKPVALNGTGSVTWDGKHIVVTLVTDGTKLKETRELSNGDLTVTRSTTLLDSNCDWGDQARQVFLVGTRNTPVNHDKATMAVAGDTLALGECYDDFNVWSYPSGGDQQWSLSVRYAFGESVSLVK